LRARQPMIASLYTYQQALDRLLRDLRDEKA
jgi:hypothetical protein